MTQPHPPRHPPSYGNTKAANQMWGGHYAMGPAEAFAAINPSIEVDKRLYQHDIVLSRAHATMLADAEIITDEEADAIINGLNQIETEITEGRMLFDAALEDIHMHIEHRLKEVIGTTAGKLHTARSRNDQVATSFRLYLRDAIDGLRNHINRLMLALLSQAELHAETLMPGFTHWQPAQPITLGHHLLAYIEMLARDAERLSDARRRLNISPLGSAALAGTSYPINRHQTAADLGFDAPCANSLDGVASRDFALEFLSANAILAIHLSRLAEELVLWSSPLIGFISLPESFTSGSSIMPQKRNPDAAELIRGKTGRIIAAFNNLAITLKALPLAYNKDLQEDKACVFDVCDQMPLCLMAMQGMIEGMVPNTATMAKAASSGHATATDLADWLVQTHAVPFREAHHIVGSMVRAAEEAGCLIHELPLATMQAIDVRIDASALARLQPAASVASRTSYGGTAPSEVVRHINQWKEILAKVPPQ